MTSMLDTLNLIQDCPSNEVYHLQSKPSHNHVCPRAHCTHALVLRSAMCLHARSVVGRRLCLNGLHTLCLPF